MKVQRKASARMMHFLVQRPSHAIAFLLVLVTLAYWKFPLDNANEQSLALDLDLEKSIQNLRQDDNRLVIVSVNKHTSKVQKNGGCDRLAEALELLGNNKISHKTKALVAEFAVLCVTDNADNRAILSKVNGIHEALVKLVSSSNPSVAAAACNLIYISSFANKRNHQGFIEAGAVKALSTAIKSAHTKNHVLMWACAALANLAASYCSGNEDGRCYWEWKDGQLAIGESSLPLDSDGADVRKAMLKDKHLTQMLQFHTCLEKPASLPMTDDKPWPGKNAIKGRDEDKQSIVTWAAAGALKNLALLPEARRVIEEVLPCLCRLNNSPDWLEQNKGEMTIFHIRKANPCFYGKSGKDYDQDLSCIDHLWMDKDGYFCNDYEAKECESDGSVPNKQDVSAKDACCVCNGGDPQKNE